jgi:AcrR family transcriptional regulator
VARTREFDEQMLLASAAEVFWTKGYDRTSIEEVAKATGVGNGSLYAAYGSKSGLYVAAVAHYCRALSATISAAMDGTTGNLEDSLREYLELIICDCVDQPGRRGCLMLNSVALIDRVPDLLPVIDRTTRELEAAVGGRLRRDVGEDDPRSDLAAVSAHYVTLSQGLIQRSRLGHHPDELRAIADVAVRHPVVAGPGSTA